MFDKFHTKKQLEQLRQDVDRLLRPASERLTVDPMDDFWGVHAEFDGYALIGKQVIFNLISLTTIHQLTDFDLFTDNGNLVIQLFWNHEAIVGHPYGGVYG